MFKIASRVSKDTKLSVEWDKWFVITWFVLEAPQIVISISALACSDVSTLIQSKFSTFPFSIIFFKIKFHIFQDVDYVCISDNYWLGKSKPCLTYGLRGICYFFIDVACADMDLHSGVFGGSVHEAMSDLIYLMGQLVDKVRGCVWVLNLDGLGQRFFKTRGSGVFVFSAVYS